jgi:hypothetical protein
MASKDKRKNKNILKCRYVVDGEACKKFAQWIPGNSERYCQKHFQLWQQQVNTRHLGDDRTGAHNNGIIMDESTSIWQQEMNGNQPFAQPRSANPVDTSTHNNGIIVKEPISIQQEQSIVTQETVQPHSVIQRSQHEPPNINSARVETAADSNDNHVDTSSGIQQEERVIAASTDEQLSLDEDMRLCEASGNNSPPTLNSAPLHRTEMINNVVQDIDENMKVFINKMFDRRDKEIDTLKHKVDKLNKECVVLTKKNDQLHVLSNGLRDVLKKYDTKERKGH